MNILIALIPALGWGIFPLIAGKIKNSQPVNELMGLGTGALIVGIIIAIIHPTNSNLTIFSLSLISGIFWTIGQSGQFISMRNIGISKTMPLSTGLQLIGNTLIGAIIFGEWTSGSQYLIGTLALVLIIIGVSLTALSKDKSAKLKTQNKRYYFIALHISWLLDLFIISKSYYSRCADPIFTTNDRYFYWYLIKPRY